MPRQVALLRGINVGGHRKVPMPALRTALEAAGATAVATYVQSGNVVLDLDGDAAAVVEEVLASAFGLDDVPVLVRTAGQLAAIVAADPFAHVADRDPRFHSVLFLGAPVAPERLEDVPGRPTDVLAPSSPGALELHVHTPEGVHDSPMARALTDRRLGTVVTGRNWRTVTRLAEMAAAD